MMQLSHYLTTNPIFVNPQFFPQFLVSFPIHQTSLGKDLFPVHWWLMTFFIIVYELFGQKLDLSLMF